ncbi:MAG: hypothetical protein E7166_03820 [Firmicutes bacterium]|nr:hypothetical protein [Bacillota bacterium]
MKNIIQYIGIAILIVFSFFYTEKTVTTIKNKDPLMIELENKKDEYSVSAIDAKIIDTMIIPGMKGCKVDVEGSYYNLKRLGEFNSNMLKYTSVKPKENLDKNYDKYIISGNKIKNTVSLIFKVKEKTDITTVISILDEKKIKASFFIDGKYLEDNINQVNELIKKGHEVLNYGYDNEYNKDLIVWQNNVIERLNYNNPKFCYVEKEDTNILNLCSNNKMMTILPNLIVSNNPLIDIKTNVSKGSLISFNINDTLINELSLIINYIVQKGYNIDVVSKHLEESTLSVCKKCNTCD